jgi:hypothetical protein
MRRADLTPVNPMRQRSLAEPRARRVGIGTCTAVASGVTVKFSRRDTVVIVEQAAQPLASQN